MRKPGDYEITVLIILYTDDCLNEFLTWKKNLLQVRCIVPLDNRKENFGYGTCSKCLAYFIESQIEGFFKIQVSVMSFYRKAVALGFRI